MHLSSEFRYPTRWYSKLIAAALALSVFFLLAAASIAGFVVYNIITPKTGSGSIDLANFPGHPEDVSFSQAGLGSGDGWFFPGLKSAPTIILCAGYQESREELLPLATALQDQRYNVLLFDFAGGNRSGAARSTLGLREGQELRAMVAVLAQRTDVDTTRFGLWGTNMGSYAAMALAETDPRVRALAVESIYDHPRDMLHLLVRQYGVGSFPLVSRLAENGFLRLNSASRDVPPLSAGLSRLAGVPKLFLEAADEPDLLNLTQRLFLAAPDPKEQAVLPSGKYAGMLDEEKRSYENLIVSFFLSNLPR
jgi:uncharacterized protein